MPEYHPVTKEITSLLAKHDMWFETFEHEPVRTSEEAAAIRPNYTLSQGAKALVMRVKKTKSQKFFVMLIMAADKKVDFAKVKSYYEAKDVRFALEEELREITNGVEPGGVPPFGNLFDLEVVVDPSLLVHEKIVFNAGDRSFSVGMYLKDYIELVKPKEVEITQ